MICRVLVLAEIADKMPTVLGMVVTQLLLGTAAFLLVTWWRHFAWPLALITVFFLDCVVNEMFLDTSFRDVVWDELGLHYAVIAVLSACFPVVGIASALVLGKLRQATDVAAAEARVHDGKRLSAITLIAIIGCAVGATFLAISVRSYWTSDSITFGNGRTELLLDAHDGYLSLRLRNNPHGVHPGWSWTHPCLKYYRLTMEYEHVYFGFGVHSRRSHCRDGPGIVSHGLIFSIHSIGTVILLIGTYLLPWQRLRRGRPT